MSDPNKGLRLHKKEHCEDRRNKVEISDQYGCPGDCERGEQRLNWFAPGVELIEHVQRRNQFVLGDRLQQTWRTGQRLQCGAQCGEQRADHDQKRKRPGYQCDRKLPVCLLVGFGEVDERVPISFKFLASTTEIFFSKLTHSPNLSLMNRLSKAAPNSTTELK